MTKDVNLNKESAYLQIMWRQGGSPEQYISDISVDSLQY